LGLTSNTPVAGLSSTRNFGHEDAGIFQLSGISGGIVVLIDYKYPISCDAQAAHAACTAHNFCNSSSRNASKEHGEEERPRIAGCGVK
jgi:hypothetical protein